jgi:hypothetical protein
MVVDPNAALVPPIRPLLYRTIVAVTSSVAAIAATGR